MHLVLTVGMWKWECAQMLLQAMQMCGDLEKRCH